MSCERIACPEVVNHFLEAESYLSYLSLEACGMCLAVSEKLAFLPVGIRCDSSLGQCHSDKE